MELLLTDLGLVATNIIGIAGSVITFVVSKPLLLIPVAIGFMVSAVALIKSFR